MKFVGREAELRLLEEHYRGPQAVLLPIYGRRRVGKSRLIEQFTRGKPSLYFLGKRATAALQLAEFREAAQSFFRQGLLEGARFDSWQAALRAVTRLWAGPGKLVLVLDELQWTAEASPELPSVLQGLWDQEWKPRQDVMVILCGSHLGFMERDVLGERSPLFGRRSDQIQLQPLTYLEAGQMLPHYSVLDQAGVYFIVGGIPAYLERFAARRSLAEAIGEEFCSELKFLALEPHFLLREELRDATRYFTILTVLADQRLRQKELAQRTGLEPRLLAAYLDTLVRLGYVGKAYPVVAGKISAHSVLYEVRDPLLTFWFRYVFPNQRLCRPGQEQTVFDQCIRPSLQSYFGRRFERLCQEYMELSYLRRHILWEVVGQYWDQRVQFDIVGLRKDNWIDLGECKWGRAGSVAALAADLEKKAALYPNRLAHSLGLHLFLQHKPRQRPAAINVHCLEELYDVR